MADLRLTLPSEVDEVNPVAGDLHVDGVDLAVVTGLDAVVQEVNVRLRWWRAEWFLDVAQGVPYLGSVLRKGVDLATVRTVLAREIRRVPGVRQIEAIDLTLDPASRRLTGRVRIRTADGVGTVEV